MTSILHAMNIGTLATWLSVTGLGTVGMAVPLWHGPVGSAEAEAAELLPREAPEIVLGDYHLPGMPEEGDFSAEQVTGEEAPEVAAVEDLPAPPELPQWEEVAELPLIPEVPARPRAAAEFVKQAKPAVVAEAPRPKGAGAAGKAAPGAARTGGVVGGTAVARGAQASSRLAAGRMPAPRYPLEARRKNQSGTVLVEFTVDSSGRVISAVAKSPSPWPLLNQEAVRTVRTWRFPPGPMMKLQRPIVFQLR
jgi:periplasmic protein TonB